MSAAAKKPDEADVPVLFAGSEPLPDLIQKLIDGLDRLKAAGMDAKGQCYVAACTGLLRGLDNGSFDTLTNDHLHTIAATVEAIEKAHKKGNVPTESYFDLRGYELAEQVMGALVQLCSHYGEMVGKERQSTPAKRIIQQRM